MKIKHKFLIILILIISIASFFNFYEKEKTVFNNINEDKKYTWNLNDIYINDEDWEKDYKKLEKNINKIEKYKGKLSRSSKYLFEALNNRDNLNKTLEKLYAYSYMKKDTDTNNNKYLSLCDKISYLSVKLNSKTSFIETEILNIPKTTIDKFIKENERLKDYKFYLENLFRVKNHLLSKDEERILSLSRAMANSPEKIYTLFRDIDRKTNLTPGEYNKILRNDNRETRKKAFEEEFKSYKKNINVLSGTLSGEVNKNIFYSKARDYKSALQASLDSDNIDVSLYNNLINVVNNNLKPLHKYVNLRKKVLNIDKVHYYDMYVPISQSDLEIDYEKAKNILYGALSPLGEKYIDDLRYGLNNRWVDVYSKENKRGGAYSWGTYDTHPFVLLNYNNTLDSVSTLAHEMGHAMNSYYSSKKQNYINYHYPIFTAEVASITNEALLFEYLIKNAKTKGEKLHFIEGYIDLIRGSIYTQVMYAEFEKTIHEKVEKGEALTADALNDIWGKLMKKYYGEDFYVDELSKVWWSRIPHFYSNFYVYKYATGCSAGITLVQNILNDEKSKEKYLEFLASGGSDYPINILKKAGVDLSSTKSVFNALKKFENLLDELEELTIYTN
ncbi:oligoendopeptidase F [Tepidibacter formicigenes]|uniref:Oligopeptidase F n=1 Tax=Tepidibacter formicigenes DSM 15518 TaxID=1123349 RepID=A0A1M6QRT6_9FIRM|nr:oligoendopeptidase F [Tepidibacter formicigenes]SHK22737.1 oligoendopeptidase F [Tepidibacter formicigenes DSM 15518]